jgi:hypothetical protein
MQSPRMARDPRYFRHLDCTPGAGFPGTTLHQTHLFAPIYQRHMSVNVSV